MADDDLEGWVTMTFQISESWDLFRSDSLVDNYIPNWRFFAFYMSIKSHFLSQWLIIVETKQSLSNLLFNSKSRDGELSRFSSRYDDDLDEVEEEDHFEDVDDLEVSFLAIIFWIS